MIGSELVQKYVGEGARMVRELFEMARSKKACIIFFDEVDAIGGARFDDGAGGDNEVQRTMLELINQLDLCTTPNNLAGMKRRIHVNMRAGYNAPLSARRSRSSRRRMFGGTQHLKIAYRKQGAFVAKLLEAVSLGSEY